MVKFLIKLWHYFTSLFGIENIDKEQKTFTPNIEEKVIHLKPEVQMRKIDYLVVHCTATFTSATIESIQRYWKETLGWNSPGYHHIIKRDGNVVDLLPIEEIANGVKGYNHNSIHMSYIGGQFTDDRSSAQKKSIIVLLKKYKKMFPNAKIQGHRDFPNVKKACPQFNAMIEYKDIS